VKSNVLVTARQAELTGAAPCRQGHLGARGPEQARNESGGGRIRSETAEGTLHSARNRCACFHCGRDQAEVDRLERERIINRW